MEAKSDALEAQNILAAYLSGSSINDYIEEMIVLNRYGVRISATSTEEMLGTEQILASRMFTMHFDGKERIGVAESVIDVGETRLIYAYPLDMAENRYIYMELNTSLVTDMLIPYAESANIIVEYTGESGQAWYSSETARQMHEKSEGGTRYEINSRTFEPFGLKLSVISKKSLYSGDTASILYILAVTVILVICIGITVSRRLSSRITGPLRMLTDHISGQINAKYLTTDPSIEEGEDEIAEIGKAFNRLVRHINGLIKAQKKMYHMPKSTFYNIKKEKREKIEEALKKEFSENIFEKASVSNIIEKAGIPRGSFYQYFEDKEDALKYIIKKFLDNVKKEIKTLLTKNDGDIFDTTLDLYCFLVDRNYNETEVKLFQNIINKLRSENINIFKREKCKEVKNINNDNFYIDTKNLNLKNDKDIEYILKILTCILRAELIDVIHDKVTKELRKRTII